MVLYSTKNKKERVSLQHAVLKGLPDDNGLYMPLLIPALPHAFFHSLRALSFPEIAYRISTNLIDEQSVPAKKLEEIVYNALSFPVPLIPLDAQTNVLELFHGPTLAFKDFGARFMARLLGYFMEYSDREITILVATSGDTGGAVAAGFYKVPGIKVVILYPKGKVSLLQQKQLTTLGENITALQVDGTFDDCQALVKQAFLDPELTRRHQLSSANSINIARLIPQSFYYFEGYKQLDTDSPVIYSVPSGNFGNLTAGVLALKMGLPIARFIAGTNENKVVPEYLKTGIYTPKPSIPTLSNAMDVGNPSNFYRLIDFFEGNDSECSTWNIMNANIFGSSHSDEETIQTIRQVFQQTGYLFDPHGAVGYLAAKNYQKNFPQNTLPVIVLGTAHPAKFAEEILQHTSLLVPVPNSLSDIFDKPGSFIPISNDYLALKAWLL